MNIEQLKELLVKERLESFDKWQALEVLTFESDYDEDYSDTVNRLTAHGYLSAIEDIIGILSTKENN